MNKNMQKTVLTTSAVLAGMVLGVNVNQNGVHADTTTNAATTATTDTNQQLANLKSQQTANESAVASSNAATMSAATTSANSQIADLNHQIKERQASDAAAQQNKIDQVNKDAQVATNTENSAYSSAFAKQAAANDTELKAAQAKVVTEQQKEQETTQENTDYQKQTSNLASEHNSNLNKINSDYQNNTNEVNGQIQSEVTKQKQDQQVAINKVSQDFDNQIKEASQAVDQAQKTVNDDRRAINEKKEANDIAQQNVKDAKDTLNSDQNTFSTAQKALQDGDVETTSTLKVPRDYIDVWKEFYQNRNNYGAELTKEEHPELWNRNHDASTEAKRLNTDANFHASQMDNDTSITFNSDGTLSRDDVIIATQYAVKLINPIREAIGVNPYRITNASIDMTMENASKYRAKGHNDWKDGHDGGLMAQIAKEWGTALLNESLSGNWSLANKGNWNVGQLKKAVYNAVVGLLFEGADGSDNGHTTDLLGVRSEHYFGGNDFLGVTYDIDPVNGNGWIRFNSIKDGKSEEVKEMNAKGYGLLAGTAADKTIQGSNYDQIAVPTPDDAIKNFQAYINKLQSKVQSDTQTVTNTQNKANATASELKSAQDKLIQDSTKLSQAQSNVNDLKANKDKTIKTMIIDPMKSSAVKKLQDKLSNIKKQHDAVTKNENNQYTAKLNDLKKNHEAKLAEIAARPTNTDALQSQLQDKLAILKTNHDAKLKQITDDANAKIATIKSQKVNDPEIDKLNAQIDQIKSDLAKKQQELDSQYQALKTKDQAEYNALAEKLKNSSSETAKGNNDHYTTDDGSATVKLPDKKTDSDKSESDNKDTNNNGKDSSVKHNDKTNGESTNTHKDITKPTTDKNSNPTNLPEKNDESEGSVTKDKGNGVSDLTDATSTADQNKSESNNKSATNVNNATAGLFEKGKNNVNSHNGNTVRKLNNSVSHGTLTSTTAATSTSHANGSAVDVSTNAPTTREEVKQQAKLPQTGNSNSLALLALGAIASMFGFGLITKKRY